MHTVVPVHTDDGQAEDTGGDRNSLDEGHRPAEEVPVHPGFVDEVAHSDGHADAHHHEVTHCQVDEEAAGGAQAGRPTTALPSEHPDGHDVAHEAHHKGYQVHRREADGDGLLHEEEEHLLQLFPAQLLTPVPEPALGLVFLLPEVQRAGGDPGGWRGGIHG